MYARPANRKKNKISCWCTPTEKKYMEVQARKAGFSASEYLRELGLKDYLRRPRTLPPEVLAFNGLLHQLAASLSLVARKRLDAEELNAFERAELQLLRKEISQLINNIKTTLSRPEESTAAAGTSPDYSPAQTSLSRPEESTPAPRESPDYSLTQTSLLHPGESTPGPEKLTDYSSTPTNLLCSEDSIPPAPSGKP